METIINRQYSLCSTGFNFKAAADEMWKLRALLANVSSGRMSKEQIAETVCQLIEEKRDYDHEDHFVGQNAGWPILVGNLPGEKIVDFVFMPTYCVCAILMRAYLLGLQDQVPTLHRELYYALEGAIHIASVRWEIFVCGDRWRNQILEAMDLFIQGGLPELMKREPEFYPPFRNIINYALYEMKVDLKQNNTIDKRGRDLREEMIRFISAFSPDVLRPKVTAGKHEIHCMNVIAKAYATGDVKLIFPLLDKHCMFMSSRVYGPINAVEYYKKIKSVFLDMAGQLKTTVVIRNDTGEAALLLEQPSDNSFRTLLIAEYNEKGKIVRLSRKDADLYSFLPVESK